MMESGVPGGNCQTSRISVSLEVGIVPPHEPNVGVAVKTAGKSVGHSVPLSAGVPFKKIVGTTGSATRSD